MFADRGTVTNTDLKVEADPTAHHGYGGIFAPEIVNTPEPEPSAPPAPVLKARAGRRAKQLAEAIAADAAGKAAEKEAAEAPKTITALMVVPQPDPILETPADVVKATPVITGKVLPMTPAIAAELDAPLPPAPLVTGPIRNARPVAKEGAVFASDHYVPLIDTYMVEGVPHGLSKSAYEKAATEYRQRAYRLFSRRQVAGRNTPADGDSAEDLGKKAADVAFATEYADKAIRIANTMTLAARKVRFGVPAVENLPILESGKLS